LEQRACAGQGLRPPPRSTFPRSNNLITLFGMSRNALTVTQNAMAPPSPTSSSLASEDDIEMFTLEEESPPKNYEPRDTAQSPTDDHDSDDDDGGESGERALLGESMQARWKGKALLTPLGFWEQTSGIVVEVSVSSSVLAFSTQAPEL
jgi:hypothetical protein